MKNWIKRHPIKFTILSLLFIVEALNFSGFCHSQHRWLSDAELIEAAVRSEATKGWMTIDASDEAIRDFIKNNPECCVITRGGMEEGGPFGMVLNRLFGQNFKTVNIQYHLNSEEFRKSPSDGDYYDAYVTTNACGRSVDNIGIRSEKKHTRFNHHP